MSHMQQNEPPGRTVLERAGAHLKTKNLKLENSKTDDASTSQGDTNSKTD